ncbi:hypothetical protein FT663_02898 [Candidozyma haemuli var. vulneris]|uniref:Nuclear condensin complex subunit 3 C-terminal domain-containing protein n=1 Tax=Candidozyma haemuli TaxID=45357 RepID=A0A2V1AUF7_9ASCO|nr:hypothetical protein CXQ85_000709 [[Candida] haemuloni]KAF3989213.1 hypothetical protein FT662_02956 [[Candida] haemuloni var. vulneris]KAF3991113.1 hypothetical protein FT663_02898 [[Candida] haemuloni var. vulneris]PVH21720.1 hypothetical protein CXQ85_000709 [[Candida] haemuloni]
MDKARPTLKSVTQMKSLTEIETSMSHVFQDAQMTLSGHRKLAVVLRNIQTRAIALDYEESFNFHFTKLVSKVLKVRKGVPAADRIAKFVTVFVKKMIEDEGETPSRSADDEDGVPTVFVEFLLRHLLRGTESKFKDVRYRITQFLAYLVHTVPEIDEDLYKALEYTLRRGLRDKEHIVRLQAVVAMSMFQLHDQNGDQKPNHAVRAIVAAMNHDESPEVRRAAMLTVTKNRYTIPEVLRRARDTNAINRRLVYGRVFSEIGSLKEVDVELRQSLLKWGLHDREVSVKQAAVNMFTKTWLNMADEKILGLLERLNVVDSDAAEPAMIEYFDKHSDSLDKVEFTEQQWRELDSERAFYIRTFLDYCHAHNLHNKLDKSLPELTVLASYLSDYLKLRMRLIESDRELLDEYTNFTKKMARFNQHILEKEADHLDLQRRISKNEKAMSQGQSHIETLTETIKKRKSDLTHLASKKADLQKAGATTTSINEKITEYKATVKESTQELEDLKKRLVKVQEYLTKDEDTFKKNAKAMQYLEDERETYYEAASDIPRKYRSFGEQMKHLEFIIEQLLLVIKRSDFADIAGTRKLQPLISQTLANDNLPDKLIVLSVQILRQLSNDESYFSNLCIEIITDIRDSGMEENDQTFVSAASLFGEDDGAAEEEEYESESQSTEEPNKRRKVAPSLPSEDLLIQCLMVLQHYLELLEDSVSSTHQFDSLIETLIRPAMCSANWEVKRFGVRCLGLVSLLDNYLTLKNLRIFGQYASKSADEELRILAIQVVFDLLSTHGAGILGGDSEFAVDSLSLARLFHTMLREFDHPRVQAVVAEGLCKLFLADLMEDFGKDEVAEDEEEMDYEGSLLRALLIAYFHPLNSQNEELKQILAFCVPVYSFSHPKHQAKVSSVSGDCFYEMFSINSKFNTFEKGMTPSTVLQQYIYWSDPREIVNISDDDYKKSAAHLWQSMKFLEIVEQDSPKAIKKLIISNLSKLCLHKEIGAPLLRGLKEAISDTKDKLEANKNDPEFVLDAPTERAFEKFRATVDELVEGAEADEAEERARAPITKSRSPSVSHEAYYQENTGSREVPAAEGETDDNADKRDQGPDERERASASDDNEEEEDNEGEAEKTKAQEKELAEIDQLLDEEDNVDYEIRE